MISVAFNSFSLFPLLFSGKTHLLVAVGISILDRTNSGMLKKRIGYDGVA